jgi:exopolysaccharide biosynthesis polyprenyl glycosylphosphotransferase
MLSSYEEGTMPSNRRFIKYLAKLLDLCCLAASVLVAVIVFAFPKWMTISTFVALRIKLGNCLLFAILLFVWHSVFVFCGLYTSKRLTKQRTQFVEVCKATMLAAIVLLTASVLFQLQVVSTRFVVIVWLVSTILMAGGRITARWLLLALRSRGRNTRFILIVGTNERAIEFARQIANHPELGYHVVGFVDDDWAGTKDFESTGQIRCCDFAGLAGFLRTNVIDEAAIYLPLRSYYEHAAELVALCEQHGIVIRFDAQVFKLRASTYRVQDLEENSRVLSGVGSDDAIPAIIKRTLDVLVSCALLAILSPLFLVVALLVKLTSPGPIFFSQVRMGLNKRKFTMFKFRTMVANAEQLQEQLLSMNEMTGPVFKIRKDPRVTPLGRVLRNASIDELPQLFNVLKGDMSLVGPRAMSLRDYQLFDKDWQRRRFCVKPGITCLWQIHGRNSIPFEKWMELDMQYIDTWSLWLDLKILLQTVPAVLRGTGAG